MPANGVRHAFGRGVLGLANLQVDRRQTVLLRGGASQQRAQFFERVGV